MLKEIYEQPEAVAETIGDRVRHGRLELEGLGLDRRGAARPAPDRHPRLRHGLPRRRRRPLRDRGVGARPGRARHRLRVDLPQPGDRRGHARDRHLAVGRDARHDRGDEARPRAGRAHGRDHEHDGLADHARGRLRPLHALRARGRRRRLEDVHRAGRRCSTSSRSKLAQVRETLPAGRDRVHPRRGLRAARQDRALPRRRPSDRGDRAALLRQAVLPLPRPPHRPAGRARGRAEAEGDLLHPDRGLLGRRDEARADRAARRGHAGRRRRDRHPRLRQDRLEHPGGTRARART